MTKTIMNNLLIEIGVEELPIASLESTCKQFHALVENQLIENQFLDKNEITPSDELLVSPRRIAIRIKNVRAFSKKKLTIKRGPREGTNNKILEKFALANGLLVNDLMIESTDKGNYYFAKLTSKAKKIDDIIPQIITKSLTAIATKKSMRWADFDFQFLRPVHWILAKHGKNNIKGEVWGMQLSNHSFGHRFHHPHAVLIDDEKNYQTILKTAKVLVEKKQREERIIEQILNYFPQANLQKEQLKNYAQQVSNLVEWPVVLVGNISTRYLNELPVEVIETILFKHQFCFIPYKKSTANLPMQNANKILEPHFITVCNLESKNAKLVIEGYQKVINARLEDGLFFYKNDAASGKFEKLSQKLDKLIFHNRLGTYKQKIDRLQALSTLILINTRSKDLKTNLKLAICYAKNDLLTQSVVEMPTLQGVFGAYLTANTLENQEVIFAIKNQYLPISRYDDLPINQTGKYLSLIDKLDSLVGLWLIGLAPKGSKDPFALRRMALAMVRILTEGKITFSLSLKKLLNASIETYQKQGLKLIKDKNCSIKEMEQFIVERMEVYFIEKYPNLPINLIQSLLNSDSNLHISKIDKNLILLEDYYTNEKPKLEKIISSFKRINNLLKNISINSSLSLDITFLNTKEEQHLIAKLNETNPKLNLIDSLNQLNDFFAPIEDFLDKVQINCEDENLKLQRQLLLYQLKSLFEDCEINFNHIQSL